MTQVKFYEMVVAGNITDEVKAYAEERFNKINERSTSKKAESEEKKEAVATALTNDWQTAKEIAETANLAPRSASYYLGVLVKEGIAEKDTSGKVNTYKAV